MQQCIFSHCKNIYRQMYRHVLAVKKGGSHIPSPIVEVHPACRHEKTTFPNEKVTFSLGRTRFLY
jgi:hypothetical protein